MGDVKAIRHHNALPGRDADDAHEQYLRIVDANISHWDDAYTHSQIVTGNPHDLSPCDVIQGDLDLDECFLYACNVVTGCVKGRKDYDLYIQPCDCRGDDLILRGSCGCYQERGGDIRIETNFNCQYAGAGDILIYARECGCVVIRACYGVDIESYGRIWVCGECIELCSNGELFFCAEDDIVINSDNGDICIVASDSISLCADELYFEGCAYFCNGIYACSNINAPFGTILGECLLGCVCCGIPLRLKITCGDAVDVCSPFIDFSGVPCNLPASMTPVLDDATLGNYTLKGGLHVDINGCRRYLLFYCNT